MRFFENKIFTLAIKHYNFNLKQIFPAKKSNLISKLNAGNRKPLFYSLNLLSKSVSLNTFPNVTKKVNSLVLSSMVWTIAEFANKF